MKTVLGLLILQGTLGAFDTIYYHEWRARLPARGRSVAAELRLHASRDFLYAALFASLPWFAWHGAAAALLLAALALEIVITLADFVVEDTVRKPLGGVYAGERVTHALMGIIYGAFLAHLLPLVREWATFPSAMSVEVQGEWAQRVILSVMAVGVLASGVRDLAASYGSQRAAWPWKRERPVA